MLYITFEFSTIKTLLNSLLTLALKRPSGTPPRPCFAGFVIIKALAGGNQKHLKQILSLAPSMAYSPTSYLLSFGSHYTLSNIF